MHVRVPPEVLLATALLLIPGCSGLPAARDTAGPSQLLPLADPMGPGDTAVGRCVGGLSERGALLKSCDDLQLLLHDAPGALVRHAAPDYRREIVDTAIGSRNTYLTFGARYAWSVERVVEGSRRIAWRAEAEISDEEIDAIAGACRGAARGGHMVVAEYHGCGVLVSSGDLSVDPPRALDDLFSAKLARGEIELRGAPSGFLLLSPRRYETDFDPASARCDDGAPLLVKTRSLADLCLERVPGLVERAARRRQEAMLAHITSLELAVGELRALLDGCRERGAELARDLDASRLENASLRAAELEGSRRLAALTATQEADRRRSEEIRAQLAACRPTPAPGVETAADRPRPAELEAATELPSAAPETAPGSAPETAVGG